MEDPAVANSPDVGWTTAPHIKEKPLEIAQHATIQHAGPSGAIPMEDRAIANNPNVVRATQAGPSMAGGCRRPGWLPGLSPKVRLGDGKAMSTGVLEFSGYADE